MKALLIPVDEAPREVDLPDGGGTQFMNSLRALIGADCAERLWITDRWEAWLDEDGRSAGKPVNQGATRLARSSLPGPVVIVGLEKDADRLVSLSRDQVRAILRTIAGAG
jgi:hypothetical protein